MLELITVFFFGLIIGSFCNVIIYRLPLGKSVVFPNSYCPSCNKPIKWYDNIPLVSYLLLMGKCRFCKKRISIQYPLIELITGINFLLLWIFIENNYVLSGFFVFTVLLTAIFMIDFYHSIIPDELSFTLIAAGLLFSPVNPYLGDTAVLFRVIYSIAGAVTGMLFFLIVDKTGKKLLKKDVIGGGDIKLLAGIGAVLSFPGIFISVFIGSLLGTIFSVFCIYVIKTKKWGEYIPYGPFLILSIYIYLYILIIWKFDIFKIFI